jgi:hypothetical protein
MSAAAVVQRKYAWDRTRQSDRNDEGNQRKPATVERDWAKRRKEYLRELGRVEAALPVPVKAVPSPTIRRQQPGETTQLLPNPQPSFSTAVEMYWHTRPCFICGQLGACGHREFEIALAYLSVSQRGGRL